MNYRYLCVNLNQAQSGRKEQIVMLTGGDTACGVIAGGN